MSLYVKQVFCKGRGVFTDSALKPGQMIEMSPVIVIAKDQLQDVDRTSLAKYWLNWPGKCGAIGLGLISLYNHADNPNAEFIVMSGEQSIVVNAIKDIEPHSEICVNYKNKERFEFIQ